MSAATNELLFQKNRGVTALTDGTPYAVFRLGPATTGSLFNYPPAVAAQAAYLEAITSRTALEIALYELGAFDGIFDGTQVLLGDVLVGEGGTYVYAEHRTCRANVCMRAERLATVDLPWDPATGDDPADVANVVYDDHYEGPVQSKRLPLVLKDGRYSLGGLGEAGAVVPVGFMFQPRSPAERDEIPNAEARETRLLYVAPTPGYEIGPPAVLTFTDGNGLPDRYAVLQTFDIGSLNLAGTVLVVAREAVR